MVELLRCALGASQIATLAALSTSRFAVARQVRSELALHAALRDTWDPMQLSRDEDAARVVECLRHLVQQLRVSAHRAERELGMSGAQLFVLSKIASEPGCSIRRLAELTLTDASSASVVVARLVNSGMVERQQDLADSRRSVLMLTKRGRELVAQAPEPYQMKLIAGLQQLPARQLRQLRVVLVKLLHTAPLPKSAPLFFEQELNRTRSVRVKSSSAHVSGKRSKKSDGRRSPGP